MTWLAIVNAVVTVQEKENLLGQQNLTPDGRFPCRFPGCSSTFKYNGKSRRNHELKHNPPVQVEDPPNKVTFSTEAPPTTDSTENTEVSDDDFSGVVKNTSDDIFNYNCALLADCIVF